MGFFSGIRDRVLSPAPETDALRRVSAVEKAPIIQHPTEPHAVLFPHEDITVAQKDDAPRSLYVASDSENPFKNTPELTSPEGAFVFRGQMLTQALALIAQGVQLPETHAAALPEISSSFTQRYAVREPMTEGRSF